MLRDLKINFDHLFLIFYYSVSLNLWLNLLIIKKIRNGLKHEAIYTRLENCGIE